MNAHQLFLPYRQATPEMEHRGSRSRHQAAVRFIDAKLVSNPSSVIVVEPAGKAFPLPEVSREATRLSREADVATANSRRSAERVVEVEQILAESRAQTFALEEALAAQELLQEELRQRLDRADRVMVAMKASLSWRITAPLRALKQRR
jgi:hypothetical protein